jgi:type II secretory pathway pseudopilin PulG
MNTRPFRQRGAYTIIELTITLVLLSAVALLAIPNLLSGDHAASARRAQAAVETATSAGLELFESDGALSASVVALESIAPRLSFIPANQASSSPTTVSVKVSSSSFISAAVDDEGWCWMLIRSVYGTGLAELKLVSRDVPCSADAASSREGQTPPTGKGESWSKVWED